MPPVLDWLQGNLSASARVWTAMAPALIICAYFIVGFLIYLVRCAIKGPFRDNELESRHASFMAGVWFRLYLGWLMQPLWRLVLRSGVPPTAITTLSVLLSLASGISLAAGRFALGGWLYIFSGFCDVIDGRLARTTGKVSKAGGALDAILDRYSDSFVLGGLAWYYRDSWVLAAALIALIGSSLVPYIRARGEALGVVVKDVGVMQRAERILYIGVGCALSPVLEVLLRDPGARHPLHLLAVGGVILLAVGTQLTAFHRLAHVLSALSGSTLMTWRELTERETRRTLFAATLATAGDFVVVSLLVEGLGRQPVIATAIGCVAGGAVDLALNLLWTFAGYRTAKLPQAGRYTFVSLTSALLNAAGVWVLLLLPDVDYRIAWVVVRAAVALAWNYPLHRDYVFLHANASTSEPGPVVSSEASQSR